MATARASAASAGPGIESIPSLRATIAAWNERALRAARSAGFVDVHGFDAPDGRRFVLLRCSEQPPAGDRSQLSGGR